MKQFKLYEKADIEKAEQNLSFFFQGDKGFLERNDLGRYFGSDSLSEIKLSRVIHATKEPELALIEDHISKRIKMASDALDDAIKRLISSQNDLKHFTSLKPLIERQESFQAAIDFLITYQR